VYTCSLNGPGDTSVSLDCMTGHSGTWRCQYQRPNYCQLLRVSVSENSEVQLLPMAQTTVVDINVISVQREENYQHHGNLAITTTSSMQSLDFVW